MSSAGFLKQALAQVLEKYPNVSDQDKKYILQSMADELLTHLLSTRELENLRYNGTIAWEITDTHVLAKSASNRVEWYVLERRRDRDSWPFNLIASWSNMTEQQARESFGVLVK